MQFPIRTIASAALLAFSGSLMAATVVTVNGTKIDSTDIDRYAQNIQKNSNGQVSDGPQLRQYIINQMIMEQLMVQEAKRLKLDKSKAYQETEAEALKQAKEQGLDKQRDFKKNWADYQEHLLIMAYGAHILTQNPVTDAQVQQQYNRIKSRYHGTDEVQLAEIVTDKANDADAAIKELNSKKKFADVAKKYSMNAETKNKGGVVEGYVSLVDLKDANNVIYQAIANLGKGQFTKTPLKDGNVHLILSINDKRKISVPAFEQMKANLTQGMEYERINQAVDALGKKASIVPAK